MDGVKVSAEIAEDEFQRFCEAMDLDVDEKRMSEEDLKSFGDVKRRVVRAIQCGHLEINGNGEPVFTPQAGDEREPIVFREPTGAVILALDNGKPGQQVHKTFNMLAEWTKQPVTRYSRMHSRDYKVCQALLTLFLA